MKSSILKRSIIIDGHKTSVSLEDAFWGARPHAEPTDVRFRG
jgi:predicted DNA-binding ribbon-helix-helix protein